MSLPEHPVKRSTYCNARAIEPTATPAVVGIEALDMHLWVAHYVEGDRWPRSAGAVCGFHAPSFTLCDLDVEMVTCDTCAEAFCDAVFSVRERVVGVRRAWRTRYMGRDYRSASLMYGQLVAGSTDLPIEVQLLRWDSLLRERTDNMELAL